MTFDHFLKNQNRDGKVKSSSPQEDKRRSPSRLFPMRKPRRQGQKWPCLLMLFFLKFEIDVLFQKVYFLIDKAALDIF